MPAGWPGAQTLPPFQALLAVLCVCESVCTMRLESLGCTRQLAFHIAFGALNIVSEDMKSCPIALCLNCHCFSPFVESQGNACVARARSAHVAVRIGRAGDRKIALHSAGLWRSSHCGSAQERAWSCASVGPPADACDPRGSRVRPSCGVGGIQRPLRRLVAGRPVARHRRHGSRDFLDRIDRRQPGLG